MPGETVKFVRMKILVLILNRNFLFYKHHKEYFGREKNNIRRVNVIINEYDLSRIRGHVHRRTVFYFLFMLTHIVIIDLLQARPSACLKCKDKN